jgi:RHS repeat-associated protein
LKCWSGEFGSLSHYDYGFRIYNPAIGKFLSVDPLTANAPGWTPYRFAFNNPLYFIDPKGLFETKADAKSYAKSEGIKTGWLSSIFNGNRIEKHGDSWSIENKKEKTSIFQDKKLANEANPDGIFKSKYFTADRIKNTENHSLEGGTVIFGQDPAGVLEGAKPVSGGSYNSIDYPFIGIRNSWSAKSVHWLHYTAEWLSFFSTVNDLNNTFKQNQPNVAPYDMITRQAKEPEMRLKDRVFYNNTHENWPDFGKSDTIQGGHERWSNGNRDSISPIYFGRYNYGNKVGSRGESGKSEKLN